MDKHIVITYNATSEEQTCFLEVLGDEASLTFLGELSNDQREQALQRATVLLSWNFPREILPQDYPSLEQVAFVQLVTAGADHMPFADLPQHILVASNPGAYATPMAEHVMAMTLALTKRLLTEHQKMRSGAFDDSTLNRSLAGMTAGILGFGGAGVLRPTLCGLLVCRSMRSTQAVRAASRSNSLAHWMIWSRYCERATW